MAQPGERCQTKTGQVRGGGDEGRARELEGGDMGRNRTEDTGRRLTLSGYEAVAVLWRWVGSSFRDRPLKCHPLPVGCRPAHRRSAPSNRDNHATSLGTCDLCVSASLHRKDSTESLTSARHVRSCECVSAAPPRARCPPSPACGSPRRSGRSPTSAAGWRR